MHTEGKVNEAVFGTMLIFKDGKMLCDVASDQKTPEEIQEHRSRIQALWNTADDLGLSTEDIQDGILREMKEFIARINKHLSNGGTIIPENGVHDAARAILAKLDKEG